MICLLLDENFPSPSVRLLRNAGVDLVSVAETAAGSSDEAVLARAVEERRAVVTFDRDFGSLLFLKELPAPPGIIYFRLVPRDPEEPGRILLEFLADTGVRIEGFLSVIERDFVRQRPLPERPKPS